MKKYLLDTHVWVWWNNAPSRLSSRVKDLILDISGYDELLLSVISVWEVCKLVEKEKMAFSCTVENWIEEALDMPKLQLVELTPRISFLSTTLPGNFHQDPADQIIATTARQEKAILLTKDGLMRQYQHVKTLW